MKNIQTVGIAGAGKMGSALAQKFAQEGFSVILADQSMTFVEKGLAGIRATLSEGIERRLFSPEQVNACMARLKGTDKLEDLAVCDLVLEAIFEDFSAKTELFKKLSAVLPADTIIATNTSSFSITELSAAVSRPGRFIGLHYFYHAAKNRLLEIVPGEKTSKDTVKAAYRFAVLSGKDPISSIDAHGFVVNRFFVPWLNEAVRLSEENIPIGLIETICRETFGIGMGPFDLMNATGIPVAYHAEKTLELFGNLYKVTPALEKRAKENKEWEWNKTVDILVDRNNPMITEIRDRMLGLVFFICSQILDEEICSPSEIDKGAKIGLRWRKGPVELMKQLGEKEVGRLVRRTASLYHMQLPQSIGPKYWQTTNVKLEKKGSVAVIRMDQPENMNALSEDTMEQLGKCFDMAENDKAVQTIFITGSGKAFVAGADIKFFIRNIKKDRICDIEAFTETGQKIFERIDHSEKNVVAIINGLALGGGLELALCADVILALPKAQMAFPETGIGIYPGLGGTQRSVRRMGKGLSKYLILTGKMLSAEEALAAGLADRIISYDEMFAMLEGEMPAPVPAVKKPAGKWEAINSFFMKNSLKNILEKKYDLNGLSPQDADRIVKTVKFKAPVALRLADQLIEEEKGCASELAHLREIFSTSDALLGLSSIGQKVVYEGK